MSFTTFRAILDKIPRSLTQIALGIGDLDANPDLWRMFECCRDNQIIPNITINGQKINEELAKKLVNYCRAVSISHYNAQFLSRLSRY